MVSDADAKLNRLIEEFLAERRESEGGWAKVTQDDIKRLDRVVKQLIFLKCEADPDGDRPIEWMLVNRHTHYRLNFVPQQYTDPDDDESYENAFDDALLNLQIAIGYIDIAGKVLRRKRLEDKTGDD